MTTHRGYEPRTEEAILVCERCGIDIVIPVGLYVKRRYCNDCKEVMKTIVNLEVNRKRRLKRRAAADGA